MMPLKKYCEENGKDINSVFNIVVGDGGSVLPARGFAGYIGEITESSLICTNDKLGVKKEIPFSCFKYAEFGIGSGMLWLQCDVDGSPFVFTLYRKGWKSPHGKLVMEKISEHTELLGMKEYERYTGKFFLFYVFTR